MTSFMTNTCYFMSSCELSLLLSILNSLLSNSERNIDLRGRCYLADVFDCMDNSSTIVSPFRMYFYIFTFWEKITLYWCFEHIYTTSFTVLLSTTEHLRARMLCCCILLWNIWGLQISFCQASPAFHYWQLMENMNLIYTNIN